MITKAFAIYDGKGKMFGVPFFMPQPGLATRAFMDLVNDPQSTVNRHPADYTLYQIGSFDDNSGELFSDDPHVLLGHGSDFKPIVDKPQVIDAEVKS